jgi:hypothetical protein
MLKRGQDVVMLRSENGLPVAILVGDRDRNVPMSFDGSSRQSR